MSSYRDDAEQFAAAPCSAFRSLVILACSKEKSPWLSDRPLPARLAYRGQAFLLARDYVEAFAMKWVILSAKYGLLWPGDKIEWYDEVMPPKTSGEEWVGSLDDMSQKQYGRLMSYDRYVCLGGEAYCHAAEMILGKSVERPLAGMSIGQRLHSLRLGEWDVRATPNEKRSATADEGAAPAPAGGVTEGAVSCTDLVRRDCGVRKGHTNHE